MSSAPRDVRVAGVREFTGGPQEAGAVLCTPGAQVVRNPTEVTWDSPESSRCVDVEVEYRHPVCTKRRLHSLLVLKLVAELSRVAGISRALKKEHRNSEYIVAGIDLWVVLTRCSFSSRRLSC